MLISPASSMNRVASPCLRAPSSGRTDRSGCNCGRRPRRWSRTCSCRGPPGSTRAHRPSSPSRRRLPGPALPTRAARSSRLRDGAAPPRVVRADPPCRRRATASAEAGSRDRPAEDGVCPSCGSPGGPCPGAGSRPGRAARGSTRNNRPALCSADAHKSDRFCDKYASPCGHRRRRRLATGRTGSDPDAGPTHPSRPRGYASCNNSPRRGGRLGAGGPG